MPHAVKRLLGFLSVETAFLNRMLDARCSMLDARCSMLDLRLRQIRLRPTDYAGMACRRPGLWQTKKRPPLRAAVA
jgi:hypothetical protein